MSSSNNAGTRDSASKSTFVIFPGQELVQISLIIKLTFSWDFDGVGQFEQSHLQKYGRGEGKLLNLLNYEKNIGHGNGYPMEKYWRFQPKCFFVVTYSRLKL